MLHHAAIAIMMIWAILYEVETQVMLIRSVPKDPIMWGIETLTMVESITETNEPSSTEAATTHLPASAIWIAPWGLAGAIAPAAPLSEGSTDLY